jgi:hypothetical protein
MGGFYIREHWFGMAKPSGFVPIAISKLYYYMAAARYGYAEWWGHHYDIMRAEWIEVVFFLQIGNGKHYCL